LSPNIRIAVWGSKRWFVISDSTILGSYLGPDTVFHD